MIPNRKTILVADNSETFVMYVSLLLNRLGFNVIPAADGKQTINLVRNLSPDIVMIGADLSEIDGISVLKRIKNDKETAHIPVIIVSFNSNETIKRECAENSCEGFLVKPVNLHDLNNILEECIIYTGGKRRSFLRTPFNKKITVKHNDEAHELFAVSLSEGGMYVRKLDPFPVGTEIEITIPIDGIESLELKGTVIYHKGLYGDMIKIAPGMGISFREMNSEVETVLRAYITELLASDLMEEQAEPIITFRRENGKSVFLKKYRQVSPSVN